MYHRLICGILAALMPLLLAAPAFAQDATSNPAVFCGDLAKEDCAILQESAAAMQGLKSYSIAMNGDFTVGGFPDLPKDPLKVGITLDGKMALDDKAHNVIKEMSKLQGPEAQATLMMLGQQLPQMMVDLYSGMDFDMSFTYTIPPELAELMSKDSQVAFPDKLTIDVRLLDGTMYINMAPFRELVPDLKRELKSDWIGIDYVGLLKQQLEKSGSADSSSLSTSAATAAGTIELMQQMQKYMKIERGKNVEVDGQQAAVFTYTPDLIGFFTSKDFQTMLRNMAAMSNDPALSKSEVEQGVTMFSFMAPMIFRDLNISGTTTIGLDDKLAREGKFTLAWDMSGLMQLASMNDPAVSKSMEGLQPKLDFAFDATYGDFDQDMKIEAPADVQMIPLDQLSPQQDLSGIS